MPKSKIAGYYRLSIEDDDIKVESNSITDQRLLIKRYIAEHPVYSYSKLSNCFKDVSAIFWQTHYIALGKQ